MRSPSIRASLFLFALSATPALANVDVPTGAAFALGGGSIDFGNTSLQVGGNFALGSGSAANVDSVSILAGGALDGGSGVLTLFGDWSNAGMFTAGTGSVISLAWPIFVAIVAVGIWRRNRPATSLVAFAALSGVLALVLPAAYGMLASAALLGALVCTSLRLLRIPARPTPVREPPSHRSRQRASPDAQSARRDASARASRPAAASDGTPRCG